MVYPSSNRFICEEALEKEAPPAEEEAPNNDTQAE